MKKKYILTFLVVIVLIFGIVSCVILYKKKINKDKPTETTTTVKVATEGKFEYKLLQEVDQVNDGNYLVSPFSIKYALMLLRDGAKGDTYNEIAKVVGQDEAVHMDNESVKIANALFLKNMYKEYFNPDYAANFLFYHNANIIYDDFYTPAVINSWANEKTDGMIKEVLQDIDPDFILGVANAIAIDVKWKSQFDCDATSSKEFTKKDGTKKNVEMMRNTFEYDGQAEYIESDKAKGIVLPYKDETNLEYIAILPNDNISDYISNFDEKEFNKLLANKQSSSKSLHINLSMPRYSYEYDLSQFATVLKKMGIVKAFNPTEADFTGFMTRENMTKSQVGNLYVSQAVHKTFIELNEAGTKAAAVTFFGVSKATAIDREQFKTIDINLDRTFLYLIREKTTNEILFMGVVNDPNEWKGSTCEKET